eukprot:m.542536 g.542536  ORF g.542536 m.542536 type:complete len:86 (-) comp57656_c0_seq34:1460-1717(-)
MRTGGKYCSVGLGLGALLLRCVLRHSTADERLMTALAPVGDQSLANEEEHDRDLRNREEAPDGGLLHQLQPKPDMIEPETTAANY